MDIDRYVRFSTVEPDISSKSIRVYLFNGISAMHKMLLGKFFFLWMWFGGCELTVIFDILRYAPFSLRRITFGIAQMRSVFRWHLWPVIYLENRSIKQIIWKLCMNICCSEKLTVFLGLHKHFWISLNMWPDIHFRSENTASLRKSDFT